VRLIDCHTHCFPDRIAAKAIQNLVTTYRVPAHSDGTVAGTRAYVAEMALQAAVILPVASRPHQVRSINDWAAGLKEEGIIAFGAAHPGLEGAGEEMERIAALGLRGIKLQATWGDYDPDDPAMAPIYRACAGRMVVYFHAGNEITPVSHVRATPERLARVLDRHPDLTAVAAHMGGYLEWEGVERLLLGRRNLYLDTSYCPPAVFPDARMLDFIRRHGADRVLFGTDFPFGHAREDLARLQGLGLTGEEVEMICHGNAERLLGTPL